MTPFDQCAYCGRKASVSIDDVFGVSQRVTYCNICLSLIVRYWQENVLHATENDGTWDMEKWDKFEHFRRDTLERYIACRRGSLEACKSLLQVDRLKKYHEEYRQKIQEASQEIPELEEMLNG
jgi:hypothetical protein